MIYEIENLTFTYPHGAAPVLNGMNLCLEEGEVLSVLGRNGAGKSTLFGCMLGLLKPQQGHIRLCGEPLSGMSPRKIASLAGYVPQNHEPAFEYTVFEFVLMGCASQIRLMSHPGPREREAAQRAIEQMGLAHLAGRSYTDLSGGERQQVTIARAIAAHPKVILFDEPTAHLDVGNQIKVLRMIRNLAKSGYSVVISTHDPNHALLMGGKAALFDDSGKALSGPVAELITEPRLQKTYGTDLRIRYLEEFGRSFCIAPQL